MSSSSSNNKTDATYLGTDYQPTELDVIVGRGKVCYKHRGNLRLARIVQSVLTTYSAAEATKKSKTELIKSIVTQVRESSPNGGFVKFDSEKGEWFEVGDRIAREKVSQTFRDALTDQYKSSSTSKTLKRRQERITRQVSTSSVCRGEGDQQGVQTTPGCPSPFPGAVPSDPVASLNFGSMSLASPNPRAAAAGRIPSMPSPSPRRFSGRMPTLGVASPATAGRGMPTLASASPLQTSAMSSIRSLASPNPCLQHSHLVSPMSAPGRSMAAASPLSASPFSMSSLTPGTRAAAQASGLGVISESPSNLRLAVAIAERKRRLANLSLVMAARGGRAGGANGFGRPQVPQF